MIAPSISRRMWPRVWFPALATLGLTLQAAGSRVTPAAPPQAAPFPLAAVRFLDGPFKTAQDTGLQYLLSLEPDRLLANFRKEAGLTPKAPAYGGWESQGIAGHSAGHYLSACALAYAATGDPPFRDRVNSMVGELAACQAANGNGYVAAIPRGKQIYAEIAAGQIRSSGFDLNGGWVPNYTLHKLFAGLRDAHRLAGSTQALTVSVQLANWMDAVLRPLSEAQMQQVLACEHGGMNEVFADLYVDTGDPRYLALSRRFHHRAILDPLARGEDILPGKHANTQIPKLIGLADRYEIAGEPSDRAAADFFWERVVHHHSYVTGGHCDHEHFGPPDRLNDRLSPVTTETCNVYNMLKLSQHVFGWRPEADVADFYERAWLNHIRSSQHPDGRVIYNVSLQPGFHKEYQSKYDAFTCCVGSGMENHVKYAEGIYFHNATSLWVNLYLASELNWSDRGVRVRLESGWPDAETARLTLTCAQPTELTLRLRQPFWVRDGFAVRVNGEPIANAAPASRYLEITRRWQTGDRVEVAFPMSLRTEPMPDNPARLAVFYGPTLLAANLGPVDDPAAAQSDYVPVLVTANRPVTDWVKPVTLESRVFRTVGVGRPREVELVPFHHLHDRRYTVYFDTFTPEGWAKEEATRRAAEVRRRALEARTVDQLRIGEMQPERDHRLEGEHTTAGEAMGRKWRHATDGGWFAFEMKVDPAAANGLLCTYWGGESGQRTFDILVDGTKVGTQTLLNNHPGEFFDVTYAIPAELTRGREKVTVRFQAHPGRWAGGLYGCRLVRLPAAP